MGLTDGCRYWSILQVVAIILCCRGNASDSTHGMMSATDEGSAEYDESPIHGLETTNYENPTTIQGDANNYSTTDEQSIGGDVLGPGTEAESSSDVGQITKAMSHEMIASRIIVAIVCVVVLIVLFAIVTIVSFILFQRKRKQENPPNAVKAKTSDLETNGKEAIYMNKNQGTRVNKNAGSTLPINIQDDSEEVTKPLKNGAKNLETTTSDYCDLEGVTRGRIQGDNDYEQLDHGRNYETTIADDAVNLDTINCHF